MRKIGLQILGSLGLLLFINTAYTTKVRTDWLFAWDAHPQAALIDYFELEICFDTCSITLIYGGNSTRSEHIIINENVIGNGTAVLRACPIDTINYHCSENSNTVIIDRTSPDSPTDLIFNR